MSFLSINNISYTYPPVNGEIETDENGNPILPKPIFDYFTADLPGTFTSLIGPNGSGKSTFMLLAAGRIKPQQGNITLFDLDIANISEEERNKAASFIYQNMEFEQDDPVEDLLKQVYENGYHSDEKKANPDFYNEVIKVFELENVLNHKLTGISKGEIQRVLLAFSILYGSKSIFMDEPMFAMEDRQKHSAMAFIKKYSQENNVPVFIAMHELDLSRKYADNVLLFYPDRNMDLGTPEEVLTDEALEKAYGVPASQLRNTERLTRSQMIEATRVEKEMEEKLNEVLDK